MPEQAKSERKKLTVIEVKPVQDGVRTDGSKWQSLAFKAKDGDLVMWFGCYKPEFHSFLTPGTVVDADIATKETERGTSHNVVMVYKDGQPVVQRRSGGFSRGKSTEEIASEETMCRARIIADLWRGDKLLNMDNEVAWLRQWLIGASPSGVKVPENSKPEVATARSTQQVSGSTSTDSSTSRKQVYIAGFEREFLTGAMKDLKWNIPDFIKVYAVKFGVKNPSDKLPGFLDDLSQKQREELSKDLQDRVDKALQEAKA